MLALHKETTVLIKNKYQGIIPTTMLAPLLINNSFVSDVYMDDISGMIYQLHHLNFEQDFIQHKHDQNWQHLC